MSSTLEIGAAAPSFVLPDTSGRTVAFGDVGDDARATVVVFTCNHCPYALAWHDRLIDAARDYQPRGVRFLFVNSNDALAYPGDSYEAMQKRVANENWPAPYLHDETQQVARTYGAATTPHLFVFDADRRLAYEGAPDDDYSEPSRGASWLRAALDDLLEGHPVRTPTTRPVGCSVKYRR